MLPHRSMQEYFTMLHIEALTSGSRGLFYERMIDRLLQNEGELSSLDNLLGLLMERNPHEFATLFLFELLPKMSARFSPDRTTISYDTQEQHVVEHLEKYFHFFLSYMRRLVEVDARFAPVVAELEGMDIRSVINDETLVPKGRHISALLRERMEEYRKTEKSFLDLV